MSQDENLYYNGNRKLKNSGVEIEWEPWQIEEIKKCAEDPVYFIDKYVKILTLSKGLVNIEMYPFQPEFIRHMHENKYSIAKFPRQTAKTTTAACYICWCLLFSKPASVGLLAQKFATAREMLARIQRMYEELPFWMQSGVKKWNTQEIELDNHASVRAIATTMNGVRGISCVTSDTVITIKNTETNVITNISIQDFINENNTINPLDLSNMKPNGKYEILGKDGFEPFSGIVDKGLPKRLLKINFDDNTYIKCTDDHTFIINDEEIKASKIKKNAKMSYKTVLNIETVEPEQVYDIANCSNTHTYYANGVLNHNCNIIYLDEFAFIPNDIATEFFKSVFPVLSTGYDKSKCIITSTPKGYNHFYERWEGAVNGTNNFKPFEVKWDAVPQRDQKWLEEQIKELGPEGAAQEIFCEFLGSSKLLVNTETLTRLEKTATNPVRYMYDGLGKVFEEPQDSHLYLHICDSAKGGGDGDYNTITVIDITQRYDYKTVFTYRDNDINDLNMPPIIADVYNYYQNGYVVCECNVSEQIPYILYYEYNIENLLCSGVDPNISKTNTLLLYTPAQKNIGIRTDKRIKKDGCASLQKLLEEDRLQPSDKEVHNELRTYIKTNNTFNADVGKHDDLISPLVLFGWMERQPMFESIIEELDLEKMNDNSDLELVYFTGTDGKFRSLDKNSSVNAPTDPSYNFFFGKGDNENDYQDDGVFW